MPTAQDSPLDQQTLSAIVEGTAAQIGEEFFDVLVARVAQALGTKGCWVTEWDAASRRLRALSFWLDGRPFGDYEYAVDGTPCAPVVDSGQLVHVPERIVELYPRDPDLEQLGAVSYMGVPLLDTDGETLGHLAVLHDRPMPASPRAEAVFRIFAGRAAAELRRLRRDRALREREQALSRLIESAMDAIVELDAELRVQRMNPAAEKTFGLPATEAVGRPLVDFVAPESRKRLRPLADELARRPPAERSLWVPEGIDGLTAGGKRFPAEATLSGFELHGRPRYTLILRNIDDRIDAERRIRGLVSEATYLREQIEALRGFEDIIGESEALRATLADVDRVAGAETTVLITGETGTGKELVARAIHRRSPRARGPLVKLNCAAIAPGVQESELFGHEKGAFTGATQRREGRFKLADGGTIFLDEVGELPSELQAKLLRVLQEGEYEPVGSSRTERVDVRVIAATNRDLERMVEQGEFRADLLYRLNVFPLRVPALRERGDDVILLAEAFARRLATRAGREPIPLSAEARARLRRYDWPGNVRELQNVIERAFITSPDGRTLELDRALPGAAAGRRAAPDAGAAASGERVLTAVEMRELERANIVRALEAAGWKVAGPRGAAAMLGLKPSTLSSRMRALGVERPS